MYKNDIKELFDNNFNIMFIPAFNLFDGGNGYKLKYNYPSLLKNHFVYKDDYVYENFDTELYLNSIRGKKFVVIEIKDLGSFVFTRHIYNDSFQILQKHYSQYTSYVFCGNETGAFFKILKDGKISRKIASFLEMEGIRNYPEIRGKPCEFEIKSGHIYKMDMQAPLKDAVIGFGKEKLMEFFDYYIGLSNLDNGKISNVYIYSVEENKR